MVRFTRPLALGDTGVDVEAVNRTLVRAGLLMPRLGIRGFQALPPRARRRYMKSTENAVRKLKSAEGVIRPVDGVYRLAEHRILEDAGAFDARAEALLKSWQPEKPRLIEPKQGFDSLDRSLWVAYSEAPIRWGKAFVDLGTYVDKPGDHGIGPPCFAFDVGHTSRFNFLGWGYLRARRLVNWYVANHERLNVNYVILGNRIWSRRYGWYSYTRDRSHDFHVHVSGVHG